jgi:hypothetical protein
MTKTIVPISALSTLRRGKVARCAECGAQVLIGDARLDEPVFEFKPGDLICFACWWNWGEDDRPWGRV